MQQRLNEPHVVGLEKIQTEFDEYQTKAFENRTPQFFALELCGEAGELANLEKKLWRDPKRELQMDRLSEEAADVFIALMNYCNTRKINLEDALKNKLKHVESMRISGALGPKKGEGH